MGRAFSLLLLACAVVGASARASTLDQESLPLASGLVWVNDNDTITRQELVVGRTGALTQIDIYVTTPSASECCDLNVYDGDRFLGASIVDGETMAAGWVSFLFTTPLAVAAGQRLRFDLENDNYLELAASDYTLGGLDWSCNIDGCANPLRADPAYAAARLADGTLVVLCPEDSGPDCYDPYAREVPGNIAFQLPIDYAFRTYVTPEPVPAALLLFALAPLARRLRGK